MQDSMKPVEKPVAVIVRGSKKVDIVAEDKKEKEGKNDKKI